MQYFLKAFILNYGRKLKHLRIEVNYLQVLRFGVLKIKEKYFQMAQKNYDK